MINRVLIRIKVIQILYSYYQKEDRNLSNVLKELVFSLDKAFELYNSLLLLLVALRDMAQARIEHGLAKLLPSPEDLNPNRRFVENRFIVQLSENASLRDYEKARKISWTDHSDFVRQLLDRIQASEAYKEYMEAEATDYDKDREFFRVLYKQFICGNEDLDELLVDDCIYWTDDKETVDTFVLKTIRRFEAKNGADQQLLPEFRDEEDRNFALSLLENAIKEEKHYRELIQKHMRNWEIGRVAFMDVVIMQTALAEILTVPGIPVTVSLNEYVDIAKSYSTPKSGGFVNGTLDGVVRTLRSEHALDFK